MTPTSETGSSVTSSEGAAVDAPPDPVTLGTSIATQDVAKDLGDKLSRHLLKSGLVSQTVIRQAEQIQEKTGRALGQTLKDMNVLTDEQLYAAYAEVTGMPVWSQQGDIAADAGLDQEFLNINKVLPIDEGDSYLLVIANPEDDGLVDMLRKLYGDRTLALAAESDIQYHLESHYNLSDGAAEGTIGFDDGDIDHLKDLALEAPIIRLVNDMVLNGIKMGASDIHLEPLKNKVMLRYRVDGVLHSRPAPSPESYAAVISRIKILANLDIAERRLPQDGRFTMKSAGKEVDVRVSTMPSVYGEDLNMRLLDQNKELASLDSIGLSNSVIDTFRQCLKRSHGLVLITGPTGSGKTTTLYAGLREIIDGQRKIITVEDPVEYEMPGITQIQVKADIGMTFASSLRSILRHDPDVILIGEIRDRETAEIAVQASLTGHLVLSTVHTNSALGAISRLLNMGVPDYLLATSLLAVSAQRLVRKLAEESRIQTPIESGIAERFNLSKDLQVYKADESDNVYGVGGYAGRVPIAEFLMMTPALQNAILKNPSEESLREAAPEGYKTLLEDGLKKVLGGQTTLEEIFRVAG